MRRIKTFLLLAGVIFLTSCASNITIKPHYQSKTTSKTSLSKVSVNQIKLGTFEDLRPSNPEAILIGRREAYGGMPMGDVFSASPVFEIIRNAIKEELTHNGREIVSDNEQVLITGEIEKFWVRTPATTMYWDVIAEVSFSIQLAYPNSESIIKLGPFNGGNTERSYLNPSQEIIERVVQISINEAMQSLIKDQGFIDALNN